MTPPLPFEEATRLAREWLAPRSDPEMDLVLVLEQTVERPYGWFFPYNSQQFLETRDFDDALAGNAPLFVDKLGHVQATGTAHALRYCVAEFEAKYQLGEWSS